MSIIDGELFSVYQSTRQKKRLEAFLRMRGMPITVIVKLP